MEKGTEAPKNQMDGRDIRPATPSSPKVPCPTMSSSISDDGRWRHHVRDYNNVLDHAPGTAGCCFLQIVNVPIPGGVGPEMVLDSTL